MRKCFSDVIVYYHKSPPTAICLHIARFFDLNEDVELKQEAAWRLLVGILFLADRSSSIRGKLLLNCPSWTKWGCLARPNLASPKYPLYTSAHTLAFLRSYSATGSSNSSTCFCFSWKLAPMKPIKRTVWHKRPHSYIIISTYLRPITVLSGINALRNSRYAVIPAWLLLNMVTGDFYLNVAKTHVDSSGFPRFVEKLGAHICPGV